MPFSYRLLILFAMIFCHLIDDYKLQGILAQMKQKSWWRKQTDNQLYKNDYKIALIEHAFSWSFTTTLPLLYIAITQDNNILIWMLIIFYIINTIIHAFIDNQKANAHTINLVDDQVIHLFQILYTWIIACAAI